MNLKNTLALLIAGVLLIVLVTGTFLAGCSDKSANGWSLKESKVSPQIRQFVAAKEAQARAAVQAEDEKMLPEQPKFFSAAARGDWRTMSNAFQILFTGCKNDLHPGFTSSQAIFETYHFLEAFAIGDETYSLAFARDIMDSIPPGSIYFADTAPGECIVAAMSTSNITGDPFFTLNWSRLGSSAYPSYLRSTYGGRIHIPTEADELKLLSAHLEAVQAEISANKRNDEDSMQRMIFRAIIDRNPERECYLEHGFWPAPSMYPPSMYPHLQPHNLIFKYNREPLAKLTDEMVQCDHEYWSKYVQPMIGNWLHDNTSVAEVATFAGKVFRDHDFTGFTGDRRFMENDYSRAAFAHLRYSLANLYLWRMEHAGDDAEKAAMAREADFAFRQAWALDPGSAQAAVGYATFLQKQHRMQDAILIGETLLSLVPRGIPEDQLRNFLQYLKTTPPL